jgi:biopolymer transport protein ExbB
MNSLLSHVFIHVKNVCLSLGVKHLNSNALNNYDCHYKSMKVKILLIVSLLASFVCSYALAAENNPVQSSKKYAQTIDSVLADIQSAEDRLHKKHMAITKEQTLLSNKIFKQQQSLVELRKKAALNRRLADEDTLSLDTLQTRLNEWKQQQQYQVNLLNRFVRQYSNEYVTPTPVNTQNDLLTQVVNLISEQSSDLYPSMKAQSIVLANGELTQGQALKVGPVSWFKVDNSNTVGLLNIEKKTNVSKVALIQSNAAEHALNRAVEKLQNTDKNNKIVVELTFDPSLNRMVASESQNENALEHLEKGGLWAIPIIAFACFALIIALLKALQLTRLAKIKRYSQVQLTALFMRCKGGNTIPSNIGDNTDVNTLSNTAATNTLPTLSGMQQVLFQLCVDNSKGDLRDDQLFNQLSYDKHSLENWIGAIAVTAAVAPLLGLLGTVSGMIETFKMMTLFGSGDPEVVSGGIAQALITTELGLVVAIPALVLNALLSRKVKYYYGQLEAFAVQLSQLGGEASQAITKLSTQSSTQSAEGNHV